MPESLESKQQPKEDGGGPNPSGEKIASASPTLTFDKKVTNLVRIVDAAFDNPSLRTKLLIAFAQHIPMFIVLFTVFIGLATVLGIYYYVAGAANAVSLHLDTFLLAFTLVVALITMVVTILFAVEPHARLRRIQAREHFNRLMKGEGASEPILLAALIRLRVILPPKGKLEALQTLSNCLFSEQSLASRAVEPLA